MTNPFSNFGTDPLAGLEEDNLNKIEKKPAVIKKKIENEKDIEPSMVISEDLPKNYDKSLNVAVDVSTCGTDKDETNTTTQKLSDMFSTAINEREKIKTADNIGVSTEHIATNLEKIIDIGGDVIKSFGNENPNDMISRNRISSPMKAPMFNKEMFVPRTNDRSSPYSFSNSPYNSNSSFRSNGMNNSNMNSSYYQKDNFERNTGPIKTEKLTSQITKLATELKNGRRTTPDLIITENFIGDNEAVQALKRRLLTEYDYFVQSRTGVELDEINDRTLTIDSNLNRIQSAVAHIRDIYAKENWINTILFSLRILLVGMERLNELMFGNNTFDLDGISVAFFNDNPEKELRPILSQLYYTMPTTSNIISSPMSQLFISVIDRIVTFGISNARNRSSRVAQKRVNNILDKERRTEELAAAFDTIDGELSDDIF